MPGEIDAGPLSTLTESLFHRYERGDRAGEGKLFSRLRNALLAEARRHPFADLLRGEHSDEDVVGEVWTVLFARGAFSRFEDRGAGSLRAFLYKILDGVVIDLVRRSRAEKRGGGARSRVVADGDDPLVDVASPAAGPSTIVRMDDWVEVCGETLREREAQVWRLRTVDGLGYDGIAERAGCTEAAARGLLRRALLRLSGRGLLER